MSDIYSAYVDDIVTLLVGGHPDRAVARSARLFERPMFRDVSVMAHETNIKTALAQRVGLVKTDKFWAAYAAASAIKVAS